MKDDFLFIHCCFNADDYALICYQRVTHKMFNLHFIFRIAIASVSSCKCPKGKLLLHDAAAGNLLLYPLLCYWIAEALPALTTSAIV